MPYCCKSSRLVCPSCFWIPGCICVLICLSNNHNVIYIYTIVYALLLALCLLYFSYCYLLLLSSLLLWLLLYVYVYVYVYVYSTIVRTRHDDCIFMLLFPSQRLDLRKDNSQLHFHANSAYQTLHPLAITQRQTFNRLQWFHCFLFWRLQEVKMVCCIDPNTTLYWYTAKHRV